MLQRPPDRRAVLDLSRLAIASLAPPEARFSPATGRLESLAGRFPLAGGGDLAASCLEFLARDSHLFGLEAGTDLRLTSRTSGIGTEHLRFAAYLGGVRIARGGVDCHADVRDARAPNLIAVESRLYPGTGAAGAGPSFPEPDVSALEAARAAEAAVGLDIPRTATAAALEVEPLPAPGRLIYRAHVDALAPRGLFAVEVEAMTGKATVKGDLLRYAPVDGKGKVFLVNPVVALRDPTLKDDDDSAAAVPAAAYAQVPLPDLDGEGGLRGPYVTTEGTPHAVRRVRLEFSFERDADAFEEVMPYYHIDSAQRFIQSIGFANVYNRRISVYANSEPPGVPYTEVQAYYLPNPLAPGTGEIAFGSGAVDLAEDAEVIIHEYGHACQDSQVPGFGSNFENLETFAIGEGWADWLAAAYLAAFSGGYGDLCVGEWASLGFSPLPGEDGLYCVRRLDSPKHYPEALIGEPHADGEMWSASLWRIFGRLGREDALRLVLESNFFLATDATLVSAASAVLKADEQLFGGANAEFITEVFTDRGFLAAPLSLTWFYLRRPGATPNLPGDQPYVSKMRLERPGTVPPGKAGKAGIEVYVHLAHPEPSDVAVTLRSPAGTAVRLHRAGTGFVPAQPIVYGLSLEPSEPLAGLAGEHISGVWSLELLDHSSASGKLSDWGLRFQGFLRGDANADGKRDLSDAVTVLVHLFQGGRLTCQKAGDVDDSGLLELTDAIALLLHLVAAGPEPPEPFAEPGEDLTPDDLTCGE